MNLLQRIIEHLQNLVLVSDITILLMSISLILMSCAYIYFVISNNNKYEMLMLRLGIGIRVLMLIGFTIEFLHQRAALSGADILDVKDKAMTQFSNYLFYGYLFIIGIYYIVTINLNKFKGFFYTFDVAMMSNRLVYLLTAMLFNLQEVKGEPMIVLLMLSLFALPYLLFKLYWKKNKKWYCLFFGIGILQMVIIAVSGMKFGFETVAFFLLIGLYDICRVIFQKLSISLKPEVLKRLSFASIVFPLVLIYSSAVAINFKPIVFNRKYPLVSMHNKGIKFVTLDEAKAISKIASGNIVDEVKLWQPNTEDFHNVYRLSIGNYAISISGITGKLTNIHFKGEKKVVTELQMSEEEIKQKTKAWLKSIGYTYNEEIMEMKIDTKSKNYTVNLYGKYSDGKTNNKNSGIGTIDWFRDGQLNYAAIGGVFDLKDYKEVKIDESTIKKSIDNWYEKLNEKTPPFRISNLSVWYDSGNKPSISMECTNGDRFEIDTETGVIRGFNRDSKRESRLVPARRAEFEETAVSLARNFGSYDTFNYKLDTTKQYYGEDSYYLSDTQGVRMSAIIVRLDAEGKMASFKQEYSRNLGDRFKLYSDKDFTVSSNEAVNKVSGLYPAFGIYSKRVKLIVEVDENGTQNFKWMAVIMPFRSSEHHIYFVDVNNGEVNPLMEYKAGVKNVKE
jgi:hypothetical protein